ncbi:PAS domain S-box-containing protein/diguanylate cyclase (GGDEF)-like protein [Sulfuritortus calidifontis]|uniref:PAS domain S-box-containing protein/diguanylate cyclase (GGDEF)-like protein n=1 Tax=Sulfuritortus calidifontis TaxID=1914471 RepID=A0A4V2UR32_9PROT|nr:bifunctional diguanylate cyclase/phosphodiesterase [Sulfuritortus calidifontis]TCS73787.1 PAS domain S-box-containing protein/diguanylate cyclase (GGDEF)-like protein [Sulfuritortus calidifontis]
MNILGQLWRRLTDPLLVARYRSQLGLDHPHTYRESAHCFRMLVNYMPQVFWVWSPDWQRVHYVSPAYESVWGQSRDHLLESPRAWLEVLHSQDRPAVAAAIGQDPTQLTEPLHLPDFRIVRTDGSIRWISAWAYPVRDRRGRLQRITGIASDITESRSTEDRMRQLTRAIEQSAEAVLITDRQGLIEYANPAFEKMTGYSQAELLGQNPRMIHSGSHDPAFYQDLWHTVLSGQSFFATFINRRKNGELYHQEETISPVMDGKGEITHFISTSRDATRLVETQERLHHMAYHDVLTGLPNRMLFRDRLEQAIVKSRRSKQILPVMFLDLDNFKDVNDTLGHAVGDLALKHSAERLGKLVRQGDTIARLGGDEFIILFEGMTQIEEVSARAAAIVEAFSQPFQVEEHEVFLGCSVGIAIYPNDADTIDDLFRAADTAMYRAKERGRSNYQFFTAEMAAKVMQRVGLERALRQALENDEFTIHYQPRVTLPSGLPTSLEALLRWERPGHEYMSPAEFVSALEDTGLIVPVGKWLMDKACAQVRAWHDQGLRVGVAVNVSSRQFWDTGLADNVAHCLETYDLEPRWLELEITENLLLEQSDRIMTTFGALEELGMRIAIDDFGTGFSSMSYLKRLPILVLKIDRSFVRDILTDPEDMAIASAIVSLGRTLGLTVVAEGVESEAQLQALLPLGCDEGQGYYFAKPMSAEVAEAWLRERLQPAESAKRRYLI